MAALPMEREVCVGVFSKYQPTEWAGEFFEEMIS